MVLLDELRAHPDPAVAYRTRLLLDGEDPASAAMQALADRVRADPECDAIIEGALPLRRHAYRKWQGTHWALVQLAERGHPGGDERLKELQELVFDWILAPSFLKPNWTRRIEGHPDRVRRCASQEGNVLWASLALGLMDDRLAVLAARLADLAWPDGGWNCDVRPEARGSSFVETMLPARGLAAFVAHTGDPRARRALDRAMDLLLDRDLIFRRGTCEPIVPDWGPRPDRIGFPIRFFDVLLALETAQLAGRLDDPRCERALALLRSKRTKDGGFPLEFRPARTAKEVGSRCTFAHWGRGGRTRSNPWVTVNALRVLREAGD